MNLKYLLIRRNTSIFIHSCIIYLQFKKVKIVEFNVNHVWNFLLVFLVWITSDHITVSMSFSLFRISHWMFWTNSFSVHRLSYYEYSCIIFVFFSLFGNSNFICFVDTFRHIDISLHPVLMNRKFLWCDFWGKYLHQCIKNILFYSTERSLKFSGYYLWNIYFM